MNEIRELRRRAGLTEQRELPRASWVARYLEVRHTPEIKRFDFPPEEWDLYETMEGWEKAANALTTSFVNFVNKGLSRQEVMERMLKLMDIYSNFGARDTEPMGVLEDLLDYVYGPSENY